MFLFYFLHFICVILIAEGRPILYLFSPHCSLSLKNNVSNWLAARGETDQFVAALEVSNGIILPGTIVTTLL